MIDTVIKSECLAMRPVSFCFLILPFFLPLFFVMIFISHITFITIIIFLYFYISSFLFYLILYPSLVDRLLQRLERSHALAEIVDNLVWGGQTACARLAEAFPPPFGPPVHRLLQHVDRFHMEREYVALRRSGVDKDLGDKGHRA